MPAIGVHHTATEDTPWDGPGAVAAMPNDATVLHYCHAWQQDGAGDTKSGYKFPHHRRKGGPANLPACRDGLSRLEDAKIPESDKAGVRAHLQAHIEDANRSGFVPAQGGASFVRAFPLDDIQIRAGGDGRTVEAYCAVFDTPTEIRDQQGHYRERLARTSFNKTIADRGTRFGVYYNHALTLRGTPSDLGSVPLGSPAEAPRVDGRGVITVSRYNRSALADSVLESIRNGDITGQSFSGRFVQSTPAVPRGGYRAAGDGSLPLVTRTEIAMTEYGPTPMPAYDVPMVVGVRSRAHVDEQLRRVHQHFTAQRALDPGETQALTFLLAQLAGADAGIDPIVAALCAADCALDSALVVVSAMLGVPNPDADADDGGGSMMADTTPADVAAMASGRRPGTGIVPAATVGPLTQHPGRTAAQRARAALIARGVA